MGNNYVCGWSLAVYAVAATNLHAYLFILGLHITRTKPRKVPSVWSNFVCNYMLGVVEYGTPAVSVYELLNIIAVLQVCGWEVIYSPNASDATITILLNLKGGDAKLLACCVKIGEELSCLGYAFVPSLLSCHDVPALCFKAIKLLEDGFSFGKAQQTEAAGAVRSPYKLIATAFNRSVLMIWGHGAMIIRVYWRYFCDCIQEALFSFFEPSSKIFRAAIQQTCERSIGLLRLLDRARVVSL